MIPDIRCVPPALRAREAARARRAPDARLPPLRYFNSSPCARHSELTAGCGDCGIELRRHQRTGTAWLFTVMRGLLADSVGLGKTAVCAAVLAMCKETGELGYGNRCVVVAKAAAVGQWAAELRRMLPGVQVVAATGGPAERMHAYLGGWEICVISDRTLSPSGRAGSRNARDGDVERLREFPVGIVIYDDVDAMRNGTTKTAYAVKRLALTADRVIGVHGTPLQKRLMELYSFLEPVGGRDVLGSPSRFRQRYVFKRRKYLYVRDKRDPTGRTKRRIVIWLDAGVREQYMPEFKRLVNPLILRRTVRDLDDVALPGVQVNNVWLDLNPGQQARYEELREGTLRRLRDHGTEITHVEAGAAFTRARQINSGLAALDDGRDDSVKLDWAMDKLTGDLDGEKVIVFVYFTPNIEALSARLAEQDIGHVVFWSREADKRVRDERLRRFREDPACRVLVGSPTIETSLNLQAAGHMIALDQIWNPQRMEQLLGRARRQGSRHAMVLFHQLLIRGTVDEDFLPLMEQEQAMADAVWDDRGELYSVVTPRRLMQMVARVQP